MMKPNVFQEAFLAQCRQSGFETTIKEEITKSNNMPTRPMRIAYIGDSTTSCAGMPLYYAPGGYLISKDTEIQPGIGTLILYKNWTATWQVPGDTVGPITPIGDGITKIQSHSPNMSVSGYYLKDWVALNNTLSEDMIQNPELFPNPIAFTDKCHAIWAQVLTGWKLEVTGWFGISGDVTRWMLSRLHQVFTMDNYGNPIDAPPDIVVYLGGVNDVTRLTGNDPAIYTLEGVLSDITKIRDTILDNGAIAILCTIAIDNPSPAEFELLQIFNNHIRSLANERTYISEFYNKVKVGESSTGDVQPNTMDGGLHYINRGGKLAGSSTAVILNHLIDSVGRARSLFAGDIRNKAVNGGFLGTAGIKTDLAGETAVDAVYVGTGSITGSKESVNGECPWQAFTALNTTDQETLTLKSPCILLSGDVVSGDIEIESSGNIINIDLIIFLYGINDRVETVHAMYSEEGSVDIGGFNGVIRTPEFTVLPWVTSAEWGVKITYATGNSVIKMRCAGVL